VGGLCGVFLLFKEVNNKTSERGKASRDFFLLLEGAVLWVFVLLLFLHQSNQIITALWPLLFYFHQESLLPLIALFSVNPPGVSAVKIANPHQRVPSGEDPSQYYYRLTFASKLPPRLFSSMRFQS